jgi:hypothetical protein
VPGILVKTNATSPIDSGEPIHLGIYLNFNDADSNSKGPPTLNLLRCLQYSPEVLFHRYFEDVGQLLQSINERADLKNALVWAKQVELILGKSIESKLREVFPKKGRKGSERDSLAQLRRDEHPHTFLQAAYGRYLCLYLLNALYGGVGIWSESAKYGEKLSNFRSKYEKFYPQHIIESAFQADPVLSELEKIFEAFDEGIKGGRAAGFKIHLGSDEQWLKQMADFAYFVWLLNIYGTPADLDPIRTNDPTVANIFISSHHAVPVANVVRKQLFEKTNGGKDTKPEIQLLYVREPAGVPFLSVIRGRIWLCDGLLAVIPGSDEKFDTTTANYEWIGEEAAAALALEKEVLFAMQGRGKPNIVTRIQQDFSQVKGEIFPQLELKDLRRNLIETFDHNVRKSFNISEDGEIDEDLIREFKVFSRRAYSRRTNHLVRGFLRQLPDSVFFRLRALKRAGSGTPEHLMSEILKKHKPVASRLKPVSFMSLYEESRSRRVQINGVGYYLMMRATPNPRASTPRSAARFAWNLYEILSKLRPYATREELQMWEEELLEWADNQAKKGDVRQAA